MVIFGGLEIVVGGYLVHRHYKNKNEKKQLEEEAKRQEFEDYRRKHHASGSKPHPDHHHHPPPAQSGPPHKYAYYEMNQSYPPQHPSQQYPQQHPQYPPPHHPQQYPQQHPQPAQQYSQPQPPPQPTQQYAHKQPEFVPQPVGRQDSFASLNSMPVANGRSQHTLHPPQHTYTHPRPNHLPPLPQQQPLQPGSARPSYPYYNTAFSASYPSFSPSSDAPAVHHNSTPPSGRQTLDDNMEAYGPQSPHVHFDVSDSPQPGERDNDPPPPYRP